MSNEDNLQSKKKQRARTTLPKQRHKVIQVSQTLLPGNQDSRTVID